MTDVNEDIDTIAGDPSVIHLNGADLDIKIEQLRTRQLFKFLKILTVGAGAALADLEISFDTTTEELTRQLIAVLLISVPDAEDEAIDFIHSMIAPAEGLIAKERSKADRDHNVALYTELYTTLQNPLPGDTLDILIKIVKNESPNMVALGKTVAALLPTAVSVAEPTTSSKKPSAKQTPAAS